MKHTKYLMSVAFVSVVTLSLVHAEGAKQERQLMMPPMMGSGQFIDSGAMMPQRSMMHDQRIMSGQTIPQGQQKPRVLSEKIRAQFIAKLDAIPVEKQESFFSVLVEKIDTLLGKAKSEKLKSQLNEMKEIVQEKLDLLTSGGEEDIVNELVQ